MVLCRYRTLSPHEIQLGVFTILTAFVPLALDRERERLVCRPAGALVDGIALDLLVAGALDSGNRSALSGSELAELQADPHPLPWPCR